MKATICFALVCCLSVALISAEKKTCETNDDCDEGQCCIHVHHLTDRVCKSYRQKDDFCFPNEAWNKGDSDFYKFMCPCAAGLTCKPEKVIQDGDVTRYINSKCIDKPAF